MSGPARARTPAAVASLTRAECHNAQRALLAWFDKAKRDLPWRHQRNPYTTWVSEVMLQQTQVATVVPYFRRFVSAYPNLAALAQAQEPEVLRLWEGLGYYSRARNLLRGAQTMVAEHAGQVPGDVVALRRIPGIGRYTAGAIASLAYQQPEPILDGNIMRVLCRWRNVAGDPRRPPLNDALWTLARQLVTNTDAARLNESLMELGAVICTPTKPQCAACPLRAQCQALAFGVVELRPAPAQRAAPTRRNVIIAMLRKKTQLLLQQQPAAATHWAGLWTFPFLETHAKHTSDASAVEELAAQLGITVANPSVLARGTYAITRFRFVFFAMQARVLGQTRQRLPASYVWVARRELETLAMPAPHRRLARKLSS